MNASDNRPIQQLVRAVLGERRASVLLPLDEYIAQNPSVFELIKLGTAGLQKLGLSREESRTLMTRGNALALYMARAFREQSLRAAPDDDQALVPLPTYQDQFNPDNGGAAPSGSPEHSASTTAYMVALREWVRDNIVPEDDSQTIPLSERRPDVDELLIDEMAINRVQSRLEIVNSVLEAQILTHPHIDISSVKAYLRTIRFHNGLPYDHDWESISHVVGTALKDGVLGDIVRRVDLDYPHFKQPGARGGGPRGCGFATEHGHRPTENVVIARKSVLSLECRNGPGTPAQGGSSHPTGRPGSGKIRGFFLYRQLWQPGKCPLIVAPSVDF